MAAAWDMQSRVVAPLGKGIGGQVFGCCSDQQQGHNAGGVAMARIAALPSSGIWRWDANAREYAILDTKRPFST